MISYKIIILLGLVSSIVCSLDIKRDESIKYGYREFTANVVFTSRNQKSADAKLYVNDKYARYDLNLWGEANLTEIIIRESINPTKAKLCGTSCDVSVIDYIPVFYVPEDAEEIETYNSCPFSNTKSCVLWKFSIDDGFNGYGYVSDGSILALEIKDLDDGLVTQTIFKDIDSTAPDSSVFEIPDSCSCSGDICFLIDGSESVLKTTFSSIKEKIAGILKVENDVKYDLRLSAVQFATRPQLIVSHTNDKDLFLSALANNTKLGGLTDIYAGLDECLKEFDNSDNEKSIVIITDGTYSQHPQLKGDPRGLAASINGNGVCIRVGSIESELFYDEDLIRNISFSKKSIFLESESVGTVASKVLNPLCASKVCKHLDCDVGYCGCGGCICPPGEEGEICRFNSPEYNGPNTPTFNGTDVVPTPESSSKAGAIVGGIIGALIGIAIIAGIVFAIVRHSRNSAQADVIGGETMTGNEAINPVYEQQGVGGENPLYED